MSFWDTARFVNWLHNGQQGPGTTEYGAYTNMGNQTTFARQSGAQYWIPTEDEWYKVAYHKNDGVTGNYWLYPTGSGSVPGRDLSDASGNNANYFGNPLPIDGPDYLTEVGEFENSASPYGTFDQGGNVWEWNEAVIDLQYRGLRGGSFNYFFEYYLRASDRHIYVPSDEYLGIGFRVASVASAIPEPGSLLIWVGIGGLGLICRRRRR